MINIVHGYLLIRSFFYFTSEKEEVSDSENTIFLKWDEKASPWNLKGQIRGMKILMNRSTDTNAYIVVYIVAGCTEGCTVCFFL